MWGALLPSGSKGYEKLMPAERARSIIAHAHSLDLTNAIVKVGRTNEDSERAS